MSDMDDGRVADATGLSQVEPASGLAPPGFDPSRKMGLRSIFRFGKYRGLTVEAVIKFNPGYLQWMLNNVAGADFDPEARRLGQRALNAEREQSMGRQDAWCWGFGAGAKRAADSNRRALIRIEHDERRKAGQETCPCFPHSRYCLDCRGAGWVASDSDGSPKGEDALAASSETTARAGTASPEPQPILQAQKDSRHG